MQGKVFIKNFKISARVGAHIHERHNPQDILVNISIALDVSKAVETDDITNTIDYVTIMDRVNELVTEKEYVLIETLADHIADICLSDTHALSACVRIEKPKKFPTVDSVGIEIEKTK